MKSEPDSQHPGAWQRIAHALDGLQFGAVEITVHHGRIVQIERREKLRLEPGHATDSPSSNDHAPEDRTPGSRRTPRSPDHV